MLLIRRICAFVKEPRFFPNSCNESPCKHQISGLQLSGDSAEPYFLAKRSLTGDTCERVDTRVLQAIYAFTQVLPGIRRPEVAVYIKAPSRSAATKNPTSGHIFFGEPPNGRTAAVVIAGQGAR